MAEARKVIITCAVAGSIHTPSMSPQLPVTPRGIADAAVRAGFRPLGVPGRDRARHISHLADPGWLLRVGRYHRDSAYLVNTTYPKVRFNSL